MTGAEKIELAITMVVGLSVVIMALFLRAGHGSWLIAGYNTMSKREKEQYDQKALCRFIGTIMLPIGAFTPMVSIGGIYHLGWMPAAYALGVVALSLFSFVYCNTGNRFKK